MTGALPKGMKLVRCLYCDFGMGTRGMDRCGPCRGTGSRFQIIVGDLVQEYPNTEQGYKEACEELGVEPT